MTKTQAVPQQWRVMTLADLGATCTSGSRGWASRYVKHGDLFIRITNLRRSSINPDLSDSRRVAVDPSEPEARRTRLAVGDVLISITADIGIIGYVDSTIPDPAYINQHIARVRLDPKRADSRFVAYYLASWGPQRGFVGSTDTGAKAGMNLATVSRLETVVPPLPEQRTIAAALGDADDQIDRLQRLIGKKRAIKQGMMQQLLTGETRMPGFDRPWSESSIGDLAQIVSGGTPKSSVPNYWDGGVAWCTPTDITRQKGRFLRTTERTISQEGLEHSAAQLLPAGSLLLCTRATIGEVKIAATPIATNQGFKSLVPRARVSGEYLYYKILTLKDDLVAKGTGSTFLEVSKRDIAALAFKVPGYDEQIAVASVLSDADDELTLLRERLNKARAIKQGMMQQLLTGRTRLPIKEVSS